MTGEPIAGPRAVIVSLTHSVISEVGRHGNAVAIVGRGGAFVLRHHPNARHVFLRTSEEARVEAVMRRSVVDHATVRRRLREMDAARGAWCAIVASRGTRR